MTSSAPSHHKHRNWLDKSLPLWLILSTVLVLLVVQVLPAFYTIWLSFQKRQPQGWEYVGLGNYQRLFNISLFSESVGHTIVFLLGYTVLTLVAGFMVALMLNQNLRFSGLYIT